MRTTANYQEKPVYIIGELYEYLGVIVLCSSSGEKLIGTCVHDGDKSQWAYPGKHVETWASDFAPFHGTVTLTSEI